MAVPGSGSELQAPGFVCSSCGSLFYHLPESCSICSGRVEPRNTGKHRRSVYMLAGSWLIAMGALVAFVETRDPAQGHAGRLVYPSESALQAVRSGGPPEPAGTFRLSKSDRIERVDGSSAPPGRDVWIRIVSGPHAGRTGVIAW